MPRLQFSRTPLIAGYMSKPTQSFEIMVAAAGLAPVVWCYSRWEGGDGAVLLSYALLSLLATGLTAQQPGTPFTISFSFLFIPLGLVSVGFANTLAVSCAGLLVQFAAQRASTRNLRKLGFQAGVLSIGAGASGLVYDLLTTNLPARFSAAAVILAGVALFAASTLPAAARTSLAERKSLPHVWRDRHFWTFRYYMAGSAGAGLLALLAKEAGWQAAFLLLPLAHFAHRSRRLYPARLRAQKEDSEEMSALHLRTIEALALAIEAKDHTTDDHLRRVQVYALEIGKDLGLDDTALKALQAAALLHDIGKLAVPEHIISKPGKLTPDEFEKMKIHPIVGAEILERVQFPYPAAPIVRSHHERWNGSGYPDGLQHEEIPIGARILSAVDCLDALASDRPYRPAIPLEEAVEVVASEAGQSYDPAVVEILKRRYTELERMARAQPDESRLLTDLRIEGGESPAAGFEPADGSGAPRAGGSLAFLASIAAARREAQMIFELSSDLGTSLSLDETLSVASLRLQRVVPFDSVVFYTCRDERMEPSYVSGENARLFSALSVPLGEGLAGWVAANGKPIVNGNPLAEPGYENDPDQHTPLRSALAVPLEGLNGYVGVLMLYRRERDAFTREDLRILRAVSYKVALALENALRYHQAESNATTDYLTGLPNARSLFLHLDAEVARNKRSGSPLAVLVCDLDGFKQVNDQHGHLEGNKVLRSVAGVLRASCRGYDYVARMGGDEFVLVLPGVDREAVTERVIELCAKIKEISGRHALSMSVGEALYPEDADNAEQLLASADRRMYQDKGEHKESLDSLAGVTAGQAERVNI